MNPHLYLLKQAVIGVGVRPEALQTVIPHRRLGMSLGFPHLIGVDYDLRRNPDEPGWRVAPGLGLSGPYISASYKQPMSPEMRRMKEKQLANWELKRGRKKTPEERAQEKPSEEKPKEPEKKEPEKKEE